ncbi:hypothetical protein [Rhizosaccharibacter radicis]|uniref:Hydroxyquinol 1,2-dioxygenase n=1 Tax=Rhizosaccharibacter radicis TaxID=2782605 RepID=A0ABT1VVB9_9PROT|nr:hypothetical protein [Acetobacteraceae bacterium KSS12]
MFQHRRGLPAPRLAIASLLLVGIGEPSRARQAAAPAETNDARHVNADENLTVRGHHSRFQPPPAPHYDPKFDPPGSKDAFHDENTGASIGSFGSAYSAANPAPPLNRVPPNGWYDTGTKVGPR